MRYSSLSARVSGSRSGTRKPAVLSFPGISLKEYICLFHNDVWSQFGHADRFLTGFDETAILTGSTWQVNTQRDSFVARGIF